MYSNLLHAIKQVIYYARHIPCSAYDASLHAISLEHFNSPVITECFSCRKYKYLEEKNMCENM